MDTPKNFTQINPQPPTSENMDVNRRCEDYERIKPVEKIIELYGDKGQHVGVERVVLRKNRRGRAYVQSRKKIDHNYVHAEICRSDGSVEDLGITPNLLTGIGGDWWAGQWGFMTPGNTLASNISTAVGATSITGTGSVWTASNLTTPQLGAAGFRVYAAPNTSSNPVVWGNVISNTTNVLTIDQWWKLPAAGGGVPITGTTPTSGGAFVVSPGGLAAAQFMALSTDSGAAAVSDKTLASEVTTNGGARVLATYAHTQILTLTTTLTLTNLFTASGTLTALHKMGVFTALSAAGADPMIYEVVFGADATLVTNDTLNVVWTGTLNG